MNKTMTRVVGGLCCVAFFAVPLAAQAQVAPKSRELNEQMLKILQATVVKMSGPVACPNSGADCNITIAMNKATVNGVDYCVGLLPEEIRFANTTSAGTTKKIVWTLDPPTMAGMEFYFQPKSGIGILIVDDTTNGQFHSGAVGNGGANPKKFQYNLKNKHNKKGAAIYLPIILQRDTSNGVVSLCGAADPKIVND
ncbi:MAG: hypothetical protein V4750_03610 [Pseudomonadota bacterium]